MVAPGACSRISCWREPSTAIAAEPLARRIVRAALRAAGLKGGTAIAAELLAAWILRLACRAAHRIGLYAAPKERLNGLRVRRVGSRGTPDRPASPGDLQTKRLTDQLRSA